MPPPSATNPSAASALPPSFVSKKKTILEKLSIPFGEYDDLSPKGSIDEGIRDLIDEINSLPGYVTTSSCSGRISIFLEGPKASISVPSDPEPEEAESNEREDLGRDSDTSSIENERQATEQLASSGGKGGGKWMFVCHDPLNYASDSGEVDWAEQFDMVPIREGQKMGEGEMSGLRLIHFKFEPMILHVLTASLSHAQAILSAALQAGFRESGALNLTSSAQESATPMVGIRSMGLAFESVIGYQKDGKEYCMIPNWQLSNLLSMGNRRFVENDKRIARFQALVKELCVEKEKKGDEGEWEDADVRRERKRKEGMEKAEAMKKESGGQGKQGEAYKDSGLEFVGDWHTA